MSRSGAGRVDRGAAPAAKGQGGPARWRQWRAMLSAGLRSRYWLPQRGRALRLAIAALLVLLLLLDLAFPLPLPAAGDTSTLVVAADGTPLRAFADAQGVWRYPASVDTVSPLYRQALLTYEDRHFARHPGINPWALLRAAGQWLGNGRIVSGGSTLTMQVARLLEPQSRSLPGKLRQLLRALQLEVHLDKSQILDLYLQRAPFGGTIEGVEAASWAYLGKPARALSHAEAALLAVLPQAPSRLRPDRHPEAARRARDKVLARMAARKVWSQAQVDDARQEPVVARRLVQPMHAALLAQRLRQADRGAERIDTTLDADLQRTLEERVQAYFARLPERSSAALLVVDNASLQARAYVGSVAFGDDRRAGHVDMVRAWRSPGSTLKPFLYAMALDDGLVHGGSLLVDAPQSFGSYRPGNFDQAFVGPVAVDQALQRSLNVPTVDLLERIGPARFAARLEHAGLPLRFPAGTRPNLSLILGGTGARLEDLVGTYAALNRGGIAGHVRYRSDAPLVERRLVSPGAAWIVRSILIEQDRPGYRADTFDASGRLPVAWKTGTSYGFRDAWAIGSTPRHTVGVWVGRPDGTPLPGQYGAITALPLLLEVVDSLPRRPGDSDRQLPPAGVSRQDVCWPGGQAPAQTPAGQCQRRRQAWVLDGQLPPTLPERDAPLQRPLRVQVQVDALSGKRLSADCSLPHPQVQQRQLQQWPVRLGPWLSSAERAASALPALAADCRDDGLRQAALLQVEGLVEGAAIAAAPGALRRPSLRLRALGAAGSVDWLHDGRWVARTHDSAGFDFDPGAAGAHTLTALGSDGNWQRVAYRVLE